MRKEQNPVATYKTRLFFLIATVSLILIVGSYIFFSYEAQFIRSQKHVELKAIAELKISQIVNWNREILSDTKMFSQSPFFANSLKNWLGTRSNLSVKLELLKRLELINSDSLYSDVMITDAKGKLLLSIKSNDQRLDAATEKYILKVVTTKKIFNTDLYICPPRNEIHLDYIAPITDKNNVVIATLILRINPEKYLYPLINEWPTPSKTSETIIVRKDGDSVQYLNELTHQKNTALKLRFPLTRKELPAINAILGFKGIFEGTSYRGTKVLAYISPVSDTPWIMIAQVDESEIYAGLYFREIVIISFTILLIIVLSVGLIWYYHYRQRNIYKELFVKEKELREYHEEFRTILYSIGDGVITTDTNGNIKQMNEIAEELTGWTETNANSKSIEEVFNIINELSRSKVENPVQKVLKEGVIVGLSNHTLLISKDGTETPIADSGAPIRNEQGEIEGVVLVFRDVSSERDAQKLMDTRLRLFEFANSHSLEELLTKTLDEVEKFTNSSIGFYHFVNPDKNTLSLQAWSTRTQKEFCKAEGKGLHYSINEAGIWVDCVHQRKPVIHNDYESLTIKKGMPEGHARVVREMVIPIFRDDDIIAIIGVGNKPIDYSDKDVEIAAYLADVVWEIVEKKKADELREKSEARLIRAEFAAKAGNWELHLDSKTMIASEGAAKIYGVDWEEMNFEIVKKVPLPQYRPMMDAAIKNLIENNAEYEIEYKIKAQDTGKIKDIHSVAQYDKENKILFGVIQDITERKKLEQERFQMLNIIENSWNEIYVFDSTTLKFEYLNKGALQNIGFTLEEIKNLTPVDIKPEYTDELFRRAVQPLVDGQEEILVFQTIHQRKDGSTYPVEIHLQLHKLENKSVFFAIINDITERNKANDALKASQTFLKNLFEVLPIPVFYKNREGKYLDVNNSFLATFGYPKEQIVGKTISDIYPFNLVPIYNEKDEELYKTESFQQFESKFPNVSGILHDVIISKTVFRNDKNEVSGLIGALLDITARKRAEEKLAESNEKYTSLFNSMSEGVALHEMVYDQDGNAIDYRIIDMNPSFETHTGLKYEAAKGKLASEFYDTNPAPYLEAYSNVAKTQEYAHFETYFPPLNKYFEISIFSPKKGWFATIFTDVTENKLATEKIAQSEKRFRSIVENTDAGYFFIDSEGIVKDVNDAWCKLYKYNSREEIIGKHFAVIQKIDDLENAKVFVDEIMHGNSNFMKGEFSRKCKDDTIGYHSFSAKPVYSMNKVIGIEGFIVDITERKIAEEALRQSEERFKQLVWDMQVGVLLQGPQAEILLSNPKSLELLGLTENQILGKTSFDSSWNVIHEDGSPFPGSMHPVPQAIATRHSVRNIIMGVYRPTTQNRVWLLVDAEPQLNEDGSVKHVICTFINITERKRAEEALRESEERFRTTLYSIGDGVIATDAHGFINHINPIAEQLTGWKEAEAKNKPLEEVFRIINETNRNTVENPVHKVLAEGKIVGLANHTLLISKNGNEIPIADSGAPIRNEKGDIDGVVLVFRDQLKERAAQKILEESEAQLKQSQRVARIGYYVFDITNNKWKSSEMLNELFGIDENYDRSAVGWLNLVHPDHREEMSSYLVNHILKEGKEFNKEYKVQRINDGKELWVYGLGSLEFDKNGNPIKMFGTIQDITERTEAQNIIRNSLKEKEILLKEIHHRVKNNFQRIISLIALQMQLIEDKNILNIFEDLQNRLRTMSLIHELMYGTGNYAGVNIKDYMERLARYLMGTYLSAGNIKLTLDLENLSLDLDTVVPCGLITNEIITNSLKYAFPNNMEGIIHVSFQKVDDKFCLILSDNGIGIKGKIDFENTNSLGLRLVDLLTKQLKGTLEVVQQEKGVQFVIKFKGES